jgi:hypothetical protein
LTPLLVLLLCPACLSAAYLTRVAATAEQSLRALPGGRVLLRQTAQVYLAAGANEVTFLLPPGGVLPEQIRLRPLTEGVTVRAAEAPRENPGWVCWLVDAAAAGPVRFALTCPSPDLTWELSYALRTAPDRATWEAWVRLVNKGAQDWNNVRLEGLPWAPLTVSLPAGADTRFPLVTFADLALARELRYEPDRYSDAVVDLVTMPRSAESAGRPFAAEPIPPGRLEVTEDPGRPGVPAKTVDLPYTPRGCDLVVSLGAAPGLTVQRRLVSSRQVNVRLDVDGRPALFDLDEQYEITVSNQRAQAATVTVVEKLAGPGEIRESSQAYQPYDAGHITFAVTAPAQTDTKLTYRLRRANLEP